MKNIAPYWKAVMAFLAPAAGQLVFYVQADSAGGTSITTSEWIALVAISVSTAGAVYAKGNKDPNADHQDESTMPPGV